MKRRFLSVVALYSVLSGLFFAWSAGPVEAAEMLMVEQQKLKFGPVPNGPDCATAAAVRGDPAKGPSVLLIKLASGCRVPWHWHTANEELMVVGGEGTVEMKDGKRLRLRAGSYASLPAREVHRATCSSACTFFNSADGVFDIHYVDGTGKEIAAEEALKKRTAPKAQKK